MKKNSINLANLSATEEARLQELYEYQILDTPNDAHFDQIAQIAAMTLDVPIVLISLVDRDRQWFKSKVGLPEDLNETARELSFCTHAIEQSNVFVIPDAREDQRFAQNPFVNSVAGVRFYAGAPLVSPANFRLGTLCVIDRKPRDLKPEHMKVLQLLAQQVMDQMEMKRIGRLLIQKNQELQATQSELQKTSEFLTQVTDLLPIGVVCKDVTENFAIKIWNKRMADATHISAAEAINKTDFELFDPVQAAFFRENDFKALAKGETVDISESLVDIYSRGRRVVRARKIPMRNKEGEMQYLLGVVEDVTELKEAQAHLVQASKLSSLGEMAAGIAHEINNPLTIIRGRVSLLKDQAAQNKLTVETAIASLDKIDQTVTRISKIISGLRSFARDGSGDPFQRMPLKDLVDNALELCAYQMTSHEIEMSVEGLSLEMNIECRGVQLIQVLVNLLNNSMDAISHQSHRQNEKWVALRICDLGSEFEIRVSDSGPGIPAEVRDRIMQPFFTTKEVGKGTGLGLSISRGIIESHKGSLKLDVKSPHTCFVIQIPKFQSLKKAA